MITRKEETLTDLRKDFKANSPLKLATLDDLKRGCSLSSRHCESIKIDPSFLDKIGLPKRSGGIEILPHLLGYSGNTYGYGWGSRSNPTEKDFSTYPLFLKITNNRYDLERIPKTKSVPDSFGYIMAEDLKNRNYYHNGVGQCNNGIVSFFAAGFTTESGDVIYITGDSDVMQKVFSIKLVDSAHFEVNGKVFSWEKSHLLSNILYNCDFTRNGLVNVRSQVHFNKDNCATLIRAAANATGRDLVQKNPNVDDTAAIKKAGIFKTYQQVAPIAEELYPEYPYEFSVFRTFAACSKFTHNGVKASVIFNRTFKDVKTKEQLIKALEPVTKSESFEDFIAPDRYYYFSRGGREVANDTFLPYLEKFENYKNARRKTLKSQANRAFSKLMEEYEFLDLDEKKYPVTSKAVKEGDLPLRIFFRKSEQYFLFNDNFDLWEQMLKKHRDVTLEIAVDASRRSTYEKDLMSYFYFVLHGLPKYLKKHTKKKWTCVPKFVNSSTELEPPKEEGGVARERSALTPTVDNENCVVTVPYASLAIHARKTTYCYAHNYCVLEEGFSFKGNVVTQEVEQKLNGRDDYGLMFYTLTGSYEGRGYPTFLIIFERLQEGTRVHFHRTHPCRSKDGDYNPIHNWIKVCYNWMIGNIKKDRIKAQQGDLAFVEIDDDKIDFNIDVNSYDHHIFASPVKFAEYTKKAKANILGYAKLENDTILTHNEHEDVPIPAGMYEIRQARSWEANPRGVWSLRID